MKLLSASLAFLLLISLSCSSQKTTNSTAESQAESTTHRFYVGTASGDTARALFTMRLNLEDGSFTAEEVTGGVRNPSFLALSPDQRFLYCINSVKGQPEGRVSAFEIDAASGSLQVLNHQSTKGRGPCYVSTDPSGRWVFVANYSSGSVSAFAANKDGMLEPASDSEQHVGSGPDPERQEGPHAHYCAMGPDGRVYAPDLGIDKVMAYEFSTDDGQLTAAEPDALQLAAGAGPRHMDFHPNKRWIYVLNELAGSVSVFDASTYEHQQTISTLPEDFEDYNKSADIHVHPNGKFLYASNRGDYNSIAAFSIDEQSGQLTYVEHQREGIAWPRNFSIDPSGKWLLAANRDDNSITSFSIDAKTGVLESTGHRIEVPKPMCIRFWGE